MKIATRVREMKMKKPGAFDHRFYIMADYYYMARELGIELVPVIAGQELGDIADVCDGLILPGSGTATDPKYYGGEPMDPPQEIDEYALDARLIDAFVKRGKPIFGICGGEQGLNIYFGGTIAKAADIKAREGKSDIVHAGDDRLHTIEIAEGSFVYDVFGASEAIVNDHHNMAVDKLAEGFTVVARCKADGIIEAIENKERKIFATQWHPEQCYHIGDPIEKKFFKNFIDCCAEHSKNAKV